jgi:hypothetical protein
VGVAVSGSLLISLRGRYHFATDPSPAAAARAVASRRPLFARQPDDVDAQTRLRTIRAKLLLQRNELEAAERVAGEAVALATGTDYIGINAAARVALADVLSTIGDGDGATRALSEALELYERKENLVQAEQTRNQLAAMRTQG